MFKRPSWLLPCILADCLISRNTWVLGYNMGKADLTNLFIEGQKVSLEAVNITVDDRKKYPGEILLLKILEIDDDQTHQYQCKKHQYQCKKITRPAVPIQTSSHPGVDEQVPSEKRHRQNRSGVCPRQQLVKSSHPLFT